MGFENTTTIVGLNELWPLGSDARSEGDDHLREIKKVLKTEFPKGAIGVVQAGGYARNRVVNGAMQISQELGDSGTTGSGAYFLDQWRLQNLGLTCGAQRQSTLISAITGNPYRGSFNVNTAKPSLAAGDLGFLQTPIEGIRINDFQWGTAQAKQVVLRFTVRAPVAGTYHVSLMNANINRSYVAAYTISAGEVGVDVSRTIVVPGDTTGTWAKDSTLGLVISFIWAAGTTYNNAVLGWQAGEKYAASTQVNVATALQQVHITDVGLYLDPDATGIAPKWQMPDEAQELAACMRYWQPSFSQWIVETNILAQSSFLPVPMRANPATTGGGAGFTTFTTNRAYFAYQTTRGFQTLTFNARM